MSDQVKCPVCALILWSGITLDSHLNTHPKEQMVEALVRLSVAKQPEIQEESSSSVSVKLNNTSVLI